MSRIRCSICKIIRSPQWLWQKDGTQALYRRCLCVRKDRIIKAKKLKEKIYIPLQEQEGKG